MADGLLADQLGTTDLTVSTIANIGPGIDFYFGFALIAVTAGTGAPLTIVAAAIAVALLGMVAAAFTRLEPSAGSFIAFVESGLGRRAGEVPAILVAIGYTMAMAGVVTMSGGFLADSLERATGASIPWGPLTVALSLLALWLMIRGVKLSTRVVGAAVALQVGVMAVVCVIVLVEHGSSLTLDPFRWSNVTGGLAGMSAGFPLAMYMFIGWENGPALAEETRDARRAVPRALALSIAAATLLFLLFSYATLIGLHDSTRHLERSSIPFLNVADAALGPAASLAWIVGVVSVLATLVAGTTSQSRMLFDAGREHLLPAQLGRVHQVHRTPATALTTIILTSLALIGIWAVVHIVGTGTGAMNAVGLYAEFSTFGTILIFFVYGLSALSLPLFVWRSKRAHLSWWRHLVIPSLALCALVVPFAELFSPGQPAPYDLFPYLALATVLGASGLTWGRALVSRSRAGPTSR